MPSSSHAITFAGAELILLADRAIHWAARRTLIVADLHLGKDASFRAAGLPVPIGKSVKDLARLTALLQATGSTRLVILGDLVHNRASHQAELADSFTMWRKTHESLEILLIRGNHDRHAGATPADWGITEVSEPFDDCPLQLCHFPGASASPHLCGHTHPVVAIRDFDRSFASIPCFVVDHSTLTLPAFGSFTGGSKVAREPSRKLFAATGNTIVAVP